MLTKSNDDVATQLLTLIIKRGSLIDLNRIIEDISVDMEPLRIRLISKLGERKEELGYKETCNIGQYFYRPFDSRTSFIIACFSAWSRSETNGIVVG